MLDWPADCYLGIIPGDAVLRIGSIELSAFVEDFGTLRPDQKAVCVPRRNPELLSVLGGELDSTPHPECRRPPPNVHNDVVDCTGENLNQLSLRGWLLKMEASESVLEGFRVIVLHKRIGNPCLRVSLGVKNFHEQSTAV